MSKPGSGGVSSASQLNVGRRERLRQLAMDSADLANDPYFMKNHLGSYECKLCLTLHPNEGSYLAHTSGKKHQTNLGQRNARLAAEQSGPVQKKKKVQIKKVQRIGRPGYKVIKERDTETGQLGLLIQIYYPKIETGLQPRYRFMSAYEQKVERPDPNFQYLLFAADPYEVISFKIPRVDIDRAPGRILTNWDKDRLTYTMQFFFKTTKLDATATNTSGEEIRYS